MSGSKKKCSHCGARITVCAECGSVYTADTEICNMCGKSFVKRKLRQRRMSSEQRDASALNDLVSVINDVKQKNIGYKMVQAVKIITGAIFIITLIITVVLGLLFSGIVTDTISAAVRGCSFDLLWTQILHTVPCNIQIWKAFVVGLFSGDFTLDAVLKFFNYFVSACTLPIITAATYYSLVYLPLDVIDMLICGLCAKKRGYNGADTVAVFECPALIYNSADSFDKAYTYFPFLQRVKGRGISVALDVVWYFFNLLYCVMALLMLPIYSILRIFLSGVYAGALLCGASVIGILGYAVTVLIMSLLVNITVISVRKIQLKRWADLV